MSSQIEKPSLEIRKRIAEKLSWMSRAELLEELAAAEAELVAAVEATAENVVNTPDTRNVIKHA